MKNVFTLFLALLFSVGIYSQSPVPVNYKNGNIWYFGERAGVDFNGASPVGLDDGVLNTQEGVASISDYDGNLMYYSDGVTVWDSDHNAMPNGNGDLDGHYSSTQSCIVVADPYDSLKSFLFTTDLEGGSNGLKYSTIDMSLPGNGTMSDPKGDVVSTEKNVSLTSPVCEKVIAVRGGSPAYHWVVAHGWGDSKFYAYKIDDSGVSSTPVVSDIGNIHTGASLNAVGYLKSSPDGSMLAAVNRNTATIDLYSFNNYTGEVSSEVEIERDADDKLYGIEFTQDNNYLYIGGHISGDNDLYRYDIGSGDLESVPIDDLSVFAPEFSSIRAIQLGPNGKIYVSCRWHDYLSVVDGASSASPELITDGIYIDVDESGRECRFGLPNVFHYRYWYNDTEELEAEDQVSVFPNPTSDILNIETSEDIQLVIFDAAGKKVYESTSKTLNISKFSKGEYVLKINYTDKGYTISKKIIKQ